MRCTVNLKSTEIVVAEGDPLLFKETGSYGRCC